MEESEKHWWEKKKKVAFRYPKPTNAQTQTNTMPK